MPSHTRAIVLLAVAGFASQAMVRVADSLLPQIAADLGVTIGAASTIVSAYAITHGSMQLVIGPLGERFGKYVTIATACGLSSVLVLLCGLAHSLTNLTLARLASGAAAAWIIPLGMAYIGDVVPYERRQQVLGRYLAGQISGQVFGQAVGGVVGDWLGWRAVFFVLATVFALAAFALFRELAVNPLTRPVTRDQRSRGFAADYAAVLANPWARIVLLAVFLEGVFTFGAFAYVGADLHLRFGLSFTLVGVFVGTFGVGGLIYAMTVDTLVPRFGQRGLARNGGIALGVAFLTLATAELWWIMPMAISLIGLGFYMLHNTLQTNATQMSPQARGTAVALFASAFYIGQTVGVALAAPVVDHQGAPLVFVAAAILLPALGFWFSGYVRGR
ncbi:MAG: MFS transporter [Bradyrhizobiaceae bacterium]|nr:MFS transporter [Bradyrhizobiaceae bacterium]